jgi:hypothetical protein
MCKGGGSASSTIDPRVYNLLSQNVSHAQGIANTPYQPYTGQLTAGLSPAQQQAGSLLQDAPAIGAGVIGAGVNAADSATQYEAPLIAPPSANAHLTAAGLMPSPAQAQTPTAGFTGMAPASAAPLIPVNASTVVPSLINPASAGAASLINPSTGQAAAVDANSIPKLAAPNGLAELSGYLNPYTQNVVNTTLADLNRQNQIALNNTNQNAASENAFGGTRQAVADSLTNDDYARAAASALANLNSAGFNTAAGLLQSNQQLGLQAGQGNLNAALNVANTNAGNRQQMALANTGYLNQAAAANQAAQNQMGEFNAGLLNTANLNNQAAQNAAGQFNAGALNTMGQFNLSNLLRNNQFNAGLAQAANQADMSAANQNAQFNAANALRNNQFNAGALNNALQFNAGQVGAANQYNAGAMNAASLANLNAALSAGEANQSAMNASQGINLQGAGLLGTLGKAQAANYLAGANALNNWGAQTQTTQQNALNAAYQQYLNRLNYPVQMQQLLNSSLGMLGGAGTSNPSAAGQSTGGLLGGIGSALGGAAGLLGLL